MKNQPQANLSFKKTTHAAVGRVDWRMGAGRQLDTYCNSPDIEGEGMWTKAAVEGERRQVKCLRRRDRIQRKAPGMRIWFEAWALWERGCRIQQENSFGGKAISSFFPEQEQMRFKKYSLLINPLPGTIYASVFF